MARIVSATPSNTAPLPPGVAAPGTSAEVSRQNHVHAPPPVPGSSYNVPLFAGMSTKGTFITSTGSLSTTGNLGVLNTGYFIPVVFSESIPLDRWGHNVKTAVATAVFRLGIYADSGGLPQVASGLITDLGTVIGSSTGLQYATIAWTPTKFVRYWACFVPQVAAATFEQMYPGAGFNSNPLVILPNDDATQGGTCGCYTVPSFATGALPATGPALSALVGVWTPPRLLFRTV